MSILAFIDLSTYKYDLLRDIFNCKEIVQAIDSHVDGYYADEPDTLIYRNIFPYLHVENTQTSSETYILLSVNHKAINRDNPTFCNIEITILILVHNASMRMPNVNAIKTDYIANELRKLLNGQTKYGFGKLNLISSIEGILNEDYQYRELVFITNDLREPVIKNPPFRKVLK